MSDYPRLDETGLTRLVNKLAEQIVPNKNVQSDWNESDTTSDAYIKNKPSGIASTNFIGTVAEWNALTLAQRAQYTSVDLTDDFNLIPIDSTPTQGSGNAVSSGGVYTAILNKQDALTFDNTPTANSDNPVKSGGIYTSLADKSNKSDLTNLNLTGSTNTTGSKISTGTFFYLNGTIVKAKTDIASNATFTQNTNYETVTVGSLNDLASQLNALKPVVKTATLSSGTTSVTFTDIPTSGDYIVDFYTSTGINYTAISISGSSVTLTYDSQSANVTVFCEIKEV